MDRTLDGSEPAKAGVEMALIDIIGKVRGLPAYDVLGGRVRDRRTSAGASRSATRTTACARSRSWIAKGVRTIKIKIGRPGTGLDEQMVRVVREGVGDAINVMVDANSGYPTPMQAVQELRVLEQYRLQLVEQPVHRRHVAGHGVRPLAHRHADPRRRIDAPLERGVRRREGGGRRRARASTSARRAVCSRPRRQRRSGRRPGCRSRWAARASWASAPSAMAHVAVCLPNLGYESDITGHLRYPVDIINERLDYADGAVRPPAAPGLGVTLERGRPGALAPGRVRGSRCATA